MTYTKTFPISFDPIADPKAVYLGKDFRFTVLTSRLLRLEYNPSGEFEDRPSQAFWYRRQPVPEFKMLEEKDHLTLTTADLELKYTFGSAGFTPETLSIKLKDTNAAWRFGDQDPRNLGGTSRTLDDIDGALVLEDGLLSRSGYAVYDDTTRLVFNPDGWLEPRRAPEGYIDLYFFGYDQNANACLGDFAKVAGPAPMVPRWALGNWWSRYWAYTADELLALMDEFKAHDVPLSVCIVDMDWHITDTGNQSTGWTGYTWNRDLFPDPPAFIAKLHQRGLKTALNLHPAEGVHPHEEKYPQIAAALGLDPAAGEPVPFDIPDPEFTRHYFELLHHPHEANGADFWWTDWQQGSLSKLPGLDPLWWLNHLHFYDLGRDSVKRPFVFSRWGGLGNHRYPIGFSGDAHVTWDSLAFQPFFTAAAANVNYGWWSHDIGGHMGGVEDAELFTRWVQFGIFSPIFRLHCTNNPFHERRPWGWDSETERITSDAMRLRHKLIPYIYTMAWRNHTQHLPLVRPMYHLYPDQEPAYHCPDQYYFGSELLAVPFIKPMDPDLRLSKTAVWLPPGEWTDFFNGTRYTGGAWYPIFGHLDEIPVFARQGAIVPLAAGDGVSNPEELEIHTFPGGDNEFHLYEDNGLDEYAITPIQQRWSPDEWTISLGAAEGSLEHLPQARTWIFNFRNAAPDSIASTDIDFTAKYDSQHTTLRVTVENIAPADSLTLTITNPKGDLLTPNDRLLETCQKLVTAFRMESWSKQALYNQLPALIDDPSGLSLCELILTPGQLRALAEVITGAGYHRSKSPHSQDEIILLWNNAGNPAVRYRFSAFDKKYWPRTKRDSLPSFGLFTITKDAVLYHEGISPAQEDPTPKYLPDKWQLELDYLDLLRVELN